MFSHRACFLGPGVQEADYVGMSYPELLCSKGFCGETALLGIGEKPQGEGYSSPLAIEHKCAENCTQRPIIRDKG